MVTSDPPQHPEMPTGRVTADGRVRPVDEAVRKASEGGFAVPGMYLKY
ncbi:MAG: hypothetical protein LLF90_11710 [Methanomicrobiaceae archaeon]|nr:hypothetical protein [Methanomicrobiaceae archaeon]